MKRRWVCLLCLALASPAYSQTYTRQNIAAILGFENNSRAGVFPAGWFGSTTTGIAVDDQSAHGGKYSLRIDRTPASAASYSTVSQRIPIDFMGSVIELRGWIKMQDAAGFVAFWMNEYSATGASIRFATMEGQGVNGAAGWRQYSIAIPCFALAKTLNFGFLLNGPGTAWIDDLELLVDGVPTALASADIGGPAAVTLDGKSAAATYDGIGAISGGGGNSRLLYDYPEPYRSEILDYLFKPGVGASLQLLKVEIGGDANSTSGAEPSHMHSSSDENYGRGYEWWLMSQAKARNPAIKLLALEWTAPGWIGAGTNFWSQDNVDYIVKWIQGAKNHYGLTIDYVGGWNECYTGWDPSWFRRLKNTLAANGLSTRIIGADEYYTHLTPSAQAALSEPSFYDDIDVVAAHYPCDFSPITGCNSWPRIPGLSKPIWSAESNSDPIGIVRLTNLMYIDAGMTASLVWPLIGVVYLNALYSDAGLILANEPWSGRYSVSSSLWAIAHTTQFAQPGWRYLTSAVGRLPGQRGSYVALVAPNGTDYSVVFETSYSPSVETVNFTITGGLSAGPVDIWSTNLASSNTDDWFVHEGSASPMNGSYSLSLRPGFVYSITTTGGQSKASRPLANSTGRSNHRLPLPYSDDFERYAIGQQSRLFSDMNGAFEAVVCGGGRGGRCLRQMAAVEPYFWWVTPNVRKRSDPYTLIGDAHWTDYSVSTDFLLEQSGGFQLLGRVGSQAPTSPAAISAYVFQIDDQGAWYIFRKQSDGTVATLASGRTAPPGTNVWHSAALMFAGDAIAAELDDHPLGAVTDSSFNLGNAGVGTIGWINAQYDNLRIAPVLAPRDPGVHRHK